MAMDTAVLVEIRDSLRALPERLVALLDRGSSQGGHARVSATGNVQQPSQRQLSPSSPSGRLWVDRRPGEDTRTGWEQAGWTGQAFSGLSGMTGLSQDMQDLTAAILGLRTRQEQVFTSPAPEATDRALRDLEDQQKQRNEQAEVLDDFADKLSGLWQNQQNIPPMRVMGEEEEQLRQEQEQAPYASALPTLPAPLAVNDEWQPPTPTPAPSTLNDQTLETFGVRQDEETPWAQEEQLPRTPVVGAPFDEIEQLHEEAIRRGDAEREVYTALPPTILPHESAVPPPVPTITDESEDEWIDRLNLDEPERPEVPEPVAIQPRSGVDILKDIQEPNESRPFEAASSLDAIAPPGRSGEDILKLIQESSAPQAQTPPASADENLYSFEKNPERFSTAELDLPPLEKAVPAQPEQALPGLPARYSFENNPEQFGGSDLDLPGDALEPSLTGHGAEAQPVFHEMQRTLMDIKRLLEESKEGDQSEGVENESPRNIPPPELPRSMMRHEPAEVHFLKPSVMQAGTGVSTESSPLMRKARTNLLKEALK